MIEDNDNNQDNESDVKITRVVNHTDDYQEKDLNKIYAAAKRKKVTSWIFVMILAIIWMLVALVPFLFMVLTGFKQKLETIMYGAFHLPEKIFTQNYVDVITDTSFCVVVYVDYSYQTLSLLAEVIQE